MNTTLALIVILKVVCLFFCWKSISLAKRNPIESKEIEDLENRLAKITEENEKLLEELQQIKE